MVCVYKGWSLPVVVEMRPAVRNVRLYTWECSHLSHTPAVDTTTTTIHYNNTWYCDITRNAHMYIM